MKNGNVKKMVSLLLCMILLVVGEKTIIPANANEIVYYNVSDGDVVISSDGDANEIDNYNVSDGDANEDDYNVSDGDANEIVYYNVSDGDIVISSDGDYVITGETEVYTIEVEAGVNAIITLDNVSITTDSASLKSPFKIADNSTGHILIILEGENKLICGAVNHAALQKDGNGGELGYLTIRGTGSLTAVGGGEAAGIGGGSYGASACNIIIDSGTVTATGGYWAAGIGGASGGKGESITVNGGTVKAVGGNLGAGIGGGSTGDGRNISIGGGTVEAAGGTEAAGIGGGNAGDGSVIQIYGGTVEAVGGTGAAGIGGGSTGLGDGIFIIGGIVTAKAEGRDAIASDSRAQAYWGGIVFQNGEGLIYRDSLELKSNVTVSAENTLTIREGQTLTIAENAILSIEGTVTNNGTIKEYGEIKITGTGSFSGNVPQKKAEGIALDKTKLSLFIDESAVLAATITPEETFETVTWNCSNEEIVEIVPNGETVDLTAKKAGNATITAKAGDVSVACDVTVSKLKGTAAVTVEDIYYGGTLVIDLASTNQTIGTTKFISLDKDGAAYTEDIPTAPGRYRIKVSYPETDRYTEAEAFADFNITYLPTPATPYQMAGTKGENGFYVSQVTLTPAEGYQISDKLDEGYRSSIVISDIFYTLEEHKNVYLMNSRGEKTAAIYLGNIKIDTVSPKFEICDKDILELYDRDIFEIVGKTFFWYADELEIAVRDDNLSKILVNDSEVEFTENDATIALKSNGGKTEYKITATDLAGNEGTVNITVAASWMMEGVIPSAMSIYLERNQVYKLGSGAWKVNGDATEYSGAQEIYVGNDGNYIFTQE